MFPTSEVPAEGPPDYNEPQRPALRSVLYKLLWILVPVIPLLYFLCYCLFVGAHRLTPHGFTPVDEPSDDEEESESDEDEKESMEEESVSEKS